MAANNLKPNWKNITKEFNLALRDLQLGELLHTDDFDFEEACDAHELMNPKSDHFTYKSQYEKSNRTVACAIVKFENFKVNELIAIMDNILCSVATHLHGNNMAQTIFTSVYMQNPEKILDTTLKTFCMAVINLVDTMRNYIMCAHSFGGWDYQPNDYGFGIYNKYSESQIVSMTLDIELKYTKGNIEPDHRKFAEAEEVVSIYSRIRFVRVLYQLLMKMRGYADQGSLCDCEMMIGDILETLPVIKSTSYMGATPG